MLASDTRIDNVLTAALRGDAERNVTGDVDVWPRVQVRLTGRGRRRTRRLAVVLLAAMFVLSASVAFADSPPVQLILKAMEPGRVWLGAIAATPVRMSLAEAEQKAGVTVLRAAESSGVRLVRTELIGPVTEILGRPVVNPQPRIRLTYDIRGATAIVEEQRNPRPGESMLLVPLGSSDGGRIEGDGSVQRYIHRNAAGDRIDFVVWGTQDLWINIRFEPALEPAAARVFVDSLR